MSIRISNIEARGPTTLWKDFFKFDPSVADHMARGRLFWLIDFWGCGPQMATGEAMRHNLGL